MLPQVQLPFLPDTEPGTEQKARECILQEPLREPCNQMYYDLKTTCIRHDGTLFDGEKIVSVTRGIRYYEHPVSMDICEDFVKLQSGRIYEEYKWNHPQLWFSDKTF